MILVDQHPQCCQPQEPPMSAWNAWTIALSVMLLTSAIPAGAGQPHVNVPELTERARVGDAEAQFELGTWFGSDPDTDKPAIDERLARDYLTRAAAQGHVGAKYRLVRYFSSTDTGPKDLRRAVQLLDEVIAADAPRWSDMARIVKARFILHKFAPGTTKEADALLVQAYRSKDPQIQHWAYEARIPIMRESVLRFDREVGLGRKTPRQEEMGKLLEAVGKIANAQIEMNRRPGETTDQAMDRVLENNRIASCKAACPGSFSSNENRRCAAGCR
jgi:hypothetical protein